MIFALCPMRNWAWSQQVLHFTHLQRWQCHSNCFRCRRDFMLMAVLRKIQRGSALYPPVSTMKPLTFKPNHTMHAFSHHLKWDTPDKGTQTKLTNAQFKKFLHVLQLTNIHNQQFVQEAFFKPDFQKRLRDTQPPLPHKHVPREKTHEVNCWKVLHSLDLVTTCIHPKTPLTVSHWCVFSYWLQEIKKRSSVHTRITQTSVFRESDPVE